MSSIQNSDAHLNRKPSSPIHFNNIHRIGDETYKIMLIHISKTIEATINLNERHHIQWELGHSSNSRHSRFLGHYPYYYIPLSAVQRSFEIATYKRQMGNNCMVEICLTYVNPEKLQSRGDYRYDSTQLIESINAGFDLIPMDIIDGWVYDGNHRLRAYLSANKWAYALVIRVLPVEEDTTNIKFSFLGWVHPSEDEVKDGHHLSVVTPTSSRFTPNLNIDIEMAKIQTSKSGYLNAQYALNLSQLVNEHKWTKDEANSKALSLGISNWLQYHNKYLAIIT
jgi:hypothetical protein